jgi:hypothetical protein
MICAICGDHAIGYNYDVLSCASCKAFFRRNANQPPVSFVYCFFGLTLILLIFRKKFNV